MVQVEISICSSSNDVIRKYDDLIENNNERISILENMAEQNYKEWFVRMRFPNYKNTKFVKGIHEGETSGAMQNRVILLNAGMKTPGTATSADGTTIEKRLVPETSVLP